MHIRRAVWVCSLIFTIAFSSWAGLSPVKTPLNLHITKNSCINDDIWYSGLYQSGPDNYVGKINTVTKKGMIFTSKEFGRPLQYLTEIIAADSTNVAFIENGDLFCYDGSQWKVYKGKNYRKIEPTTSGKIWAVSDDSVFCIVKGEKGSSFFRDSIGLTDTLRGLSVDDSDNVYVITNHHIGKYNNDKWTVLIEDKSLNLWSTERIVDGTVQFSGTNSNYRFVDNELKAVSLVWEQNNSAQKDSNGNIWSYFQPEKGTYKLQMSKSDTIINSTNAQQYGWKNWPELYARGPYYTSIMACKKHVYVRFVNGFYHYAGDPENLIWEWIPVNTSVDLADAFGANILFPARDSSVYIMNELRSELIQYKSGKFQTFPWFVDTWIHCFFVDREGTLWAGGNDLYKFENSIWKKQLLGVSEVKQITEDASGRLLVIVYAANQEMIIRKNNKNWEFFNSSNSNSPMNSIEYIIDNNDLIWSGTQKQGIGRSKDIFQWSYYDSINSTLPANLVTSIISTSEGSIIASIQKSQVFYSPYWIFKFDGEKWINLGAPLDSASNGILCEDKQGRIWYGSAVTYSPLLSYYENSQWKIVDINKPIRDIKEDRYGQLWISTDKGIYLYDSTGTAAVKRNNQHTRNGTQLSVNRTGKSALIKYNLDKPANVTLEVFTLQGKFISILKKGYQSAGSYQLSWINKTAGGMYLIRLTTPVSVYTSTFKAY